MNTTRLIRPRAHVVGGVCAGFAEHTGLPVGTVRAAAVVTALCGGAGALLYAWLWVTTPLAEERRPTKAALTAPASGNPSASLGGTADSSPDPGNEDTASGTFQPGASENGGRRARAPITEVLLGVALLMAGAAMIASRLGADVPLSFIVPAVVVLAGAGLAWRQFDQLRRGRRDGRSGDVVRALGALVLVVLGILLFFVTGDRPNVWTVFTAAAAVLIGVGVVIAPWAVRLMRDLAEERAGRAREVERAEVAAHLHDSVLQTLALIQQKAEPGSEASRLARAQERELRDWLFAENSSGPLDLAAELRRIASALESDFTARIEVVTAGVSVPEAPEALIAATREAMLNAAEHAGGTVTVYAECSPTTIEITISDRGPGFDLGDIPDGRFGVKESIIGRMGRIGGQARVRRGPGGTGTEVTLRLDHEQHSA